MEFVRTRQSILNYYLTCQSKFTSQEFIWNNQVRGRLFNLRKLKWDFTLIVAMQIGTPAIIIEIFLTTYPSLLISLTRYYNFIYYQGECILLISEVSKLSLIGELNQFHRQCSIWFQSARLFIIMWSKQHANLSWGPLKPRLSPPSNVTGFRISILHYLLMTPWSMIRFLFLTLDVAINPRK